MVTNLSFLKEKKARKERFLAIWSNIGIVSHASTSENSCKAYHKQSRKLHKKPPLQAKPRKLHQLQNAGASKLLKYLQKWQSDREKTAKTCS